MLWGTCGSKRTTCRSLVGPSMWTMLVLGIKHQDLEASSLPAETSLYPKISDNFNSQSLIFFFCKVTQTLTISYFCQCLLKCLSCWNICQLSLWHFYFFFLYGVSSQLCSKKLTVVSLSYLTPVPKITDLLPTTHSIILASNTSRHSLGTQQLSRTGKQVS